MSEICGEFVKQALQIFINRVKQSIAAESVNMEHVKAVQRLQYFSQCKYFKNCPFGYLCLIDSPWSKEVCEAVIRLEESGLIEITEVDKNARNKANLHSG